MSWKWFNRLFQLHPGWQWGSRMAPVLIRTLDCRMSFPGAQCSSWIMEMRTGIREHWGIRASHRRTQSILGLQQYTWVSCSFVSILSTPTLLWYICTLSDSHSNPAQLILLSHCTDKGTETYPVSDRTRLQTQNHLTPKCLIFLFYCAVSFKKSKLQPLARKTGSGTCQGWQVKSPGSPTCIWAAPKKAETDMVLNAVGNTTEVNDCPS